MRKPLIMYGARQVGKTYYHTDNHGCPRTTRRIILSHGQSRMSTDSTENYILSHGQSRISTDDTENYIITRTIADVH